MQEIITCVGRVCCDSESHLNAASIVLEGAHSVSSGRTIKLDLSKLRQYSLFPGQIIAVQGVTPTGGTLIAHKIYTSAALPSPENPPSINGMNLCSYNLWYEVSVYCFLSYLFNIVRKMLFKHIIV